MRKVFAQASAHQKPSFKGLILFDTRRAKGLSAGAPPRSPPPKSANHCREDETEVKYDEDEDEAGWITSLTRGRHDVGWGLFA